MESSGLAAFRRIGAGLAVLGAVVLGSVDTAAAATLEPWEPTPALELAATMSYGDPGGLAVAPEGATAAFWSNSDGDLVARTRTANADAYGAEETIGGSLLASAGGPGNRIGVVTLVTGSIELHTREADGAFSAPMVVDSGTSGDLVNADVALGPNGGIAVAWAIRSGRSYDVYARVGTVRGGVSTLEPTVKLTSSSLIWLKARVAIGPDGRVAVGWNTQVGYTGGAPRQELWEVQTRVRPGSGGAFGAVTTAEAFAPDEAVEWMELEYDGDSRLVVAYQSAANHNGGSPNPLTVGTIALRSGQTTFSLPVVAATYTGQAGGFDLGVATDGAVSIGWEEYGDTEASLYVATLSPAAVAFGAAQKLTAEGSYPDSLELAVAANGAAVAVWRGQTIVGEDTAGTLYARVRSAGANSFGEAFVLAPAVVFSGTGSGSQTWYAKLAVGTAADGSATAFWTDPSTGLWTPKTRRARMGSEVVTPAAVVTPSVPNKTEQIAISKLSAEVRPQTIVVKATVTATASGLVRLMTTNVGNMRHPRRWRCITKVTVKAGLPTQLECTLPLGARRQLGRGALWLSTAFRLTPTGSEIADSYRHLVVWQTTRFAG